MFSNLCAYVAISALTFTCVGGGFAAYADGLDGLPQNVELKVYDEKTGKLMFLGKERNDLANGVISRVTTYTDSAGKKLQEERVKYRAKSLRVLSQSSRNFVTGTKVDMTPLKSDDPNTAAVTLRFQEKAGSETKTKELASENLYLGNVMHHIVIRNWQRLTEDKKRVVVNLIAPTRLDYYSFRLSSKEPAPQEEKVTKTVVKKTAADGTSSTVVTTTKSAQPGTPSVIVLEPDSWLIRSLVDPMEFFYKNGRLMEFRGITPVVIDDNPYRRTRFVFSYPSS